jgi:hypothetical protein
VGAFPAKRGRRPLVGETRPDAEAGPVVAGDSLAWRNARLGPAIGTVEVLPKQACDSELSDVRIPLIALVALMRWVMRPSVPSSASASNWMRTACVPVLVGAIDNIGAGSQNRAAFIGSGVFGEDEGGNTARGCRCQAGVAWRYVWLKRASVSRANCVALLS